MGREPGEVVTSGAKLPTVSSLAQQMVAAAVSRDSNFSLSPSQLRSLFSQSLRRGKDLALCSVSYYEDVVSIVRAYMDIK